MTVLVDVTNVSNYTPSAANTTLNAPVTIGAGDNFLLVVCNCWQTNIFNGVAPTFNGVNMLQATAQDGVGLSGGQSQEIWYLANPPVGTYTFAGNTLGNTSGGTNAFTFVPLSGVNTAAPFGTPNYVQSGTLATAAPTATGANTGGKYIGTGFVEYTLIANGGGFDTNLATLLNVAGASVMVDYIPANHPGAFSYTGSGGPNTGAVGTAVAVQPSTETPVIETFAPVSLPIIIGTGIVPTTTSPVLPTTVQNGLIVDADGHVVVSTGPVAGWSAAGLPFDSSGNLCLTGSPTAPTQWHDGLQFDANGLLCATTSPTGYTTTQNGLLIDSLGLVVVTAI